MRLMRVGPRGRERPVAVEDGVSYDVSRVTPDIDAEFFASGGIARVARAIEEGTLPIVSLDGLRVGSPIATPPSIICIGMNYAAHAAESGAAPPERLVLFFKKGNTVVGPNDPILLPRGAEKVDWEVELAIIIGSRGRYLDDDESALAIIGGYALANDLSERAFQIEHSGGQWSKGKSSEDFAPMGPWISTPDEVPDVQALDLKSWVNSEPRQDSSTADMVFPVATIVRELSQYMVLEPGDVIFTGTPEGVALSGRFPYLKSGDIVSMEIDSLGRIEQQVRDWDEVSR